jgi:hypothetical protein
MSFPAHLRVCFFLLAALLMTRALASNNCPLGEIRCVSGATASGGCFDPAVSRCHDGLICVASSLFAGAALLGLERAFGPIGLPATWEGYAFSPITPCTPKPTVDANRHYPACSARRGT